MHTDRLLKTTTMKLILLLTLCAPMVQPQGRATPNPEAAANLPAQKIGPRDLIMVQVYGSPELSRSVRVGADGMLRLPMLKQRIKGEGMMPNDLEVMVAQALEEEGLIVDPMVTITVAEYSSRPISVAGAVKEPLTFQASAPVTLLEAITRAGGLTPVAGSEILVSKAQTGPGGQPTSLMQRVSVKALIEGTDPEANLRLSGGEEVRVPEAGKVFVVGNVKRPGAFPVEDGAETSVLRMLARAEGLTPSPASWRISTAAKLPGARTRYRSRSTRSCYVKLRTPPCWPTTSCTFPTIATAGWDWRSSKSCCSSAARQGQLPWYTVPGKTPWLTTIS